MNRSKKLVKITRAMKGKGRFAVYTDSTFPLDEMNVFLSTKRYRSEKEFQDQNCEEWNVLHWYKNRKDWEKVGYRQGFLEFFNKTKGASYVSPCPD